MEMLNELLGQRDSVNLLYSTKLRLWGLWDIVNLWWYASHRLLGQCFLVNLVIDAKLNSLDREVVVNQLNGVQHNPWGPGFNC